MDWSLASIFAAGPDESGLRPTLGAVLLGCFFSAFLSGVVTMQVYLYYSIYPKDGWYFKSVVTVIWFVDLLHTLMASAANWSYLIVNFGFVDINDHITWSIAVTVALTALMTFLVQIFFIHRIYTVSGGNLWITVPGAVLTLFRLVVAIVSTGEMIRLQSYTGFVDDFAWVFTMGLGSAVAVDMIIVYGLCYHLRKGRVGFSSWEDTVDTFVLYIVETGILTCVTTIASLICWVTMSRNLIFLGLHFTISKLYANSLLATLNSRKTIRGRSQDSSSDHARPVLFPDNFSRRFATRSRLDDPINTKVEINVQKTVQRGSYETPNSSEPDLKGRDVVSIP